MAKIKYIGFLVFLFITPIQAQRIKIGDIQEPIRKFDERIKRMGAAVTTKFSGGTSGDAAIFSNWTNGLPRGASDKAVIPATTSQAITSNFGTIPAEQTLTFVADPTDGDDVTIASTVYRFKTTMALAFDVQLDGSDATVSMANLIAAINLTGTEGTEYFAGTTQHPTAYATDEAGDTMAAIARTAGTAGNSIATTENFTDGGNVWGAGTMALGAATGLLNAVLHIERGYDKDIMSEGSKAIIATTRIIQRGGGTLYLQPWDNQLIDTIVCDSRNNVDAIVISGTKNVLSVSLRSAIEIIRGKVVWNPDSGLVNIVSVVLLVSGQSFFEATGSFGSTTKISDVYVASGTAVIPFKVSAIHMTGGRYIHDAASDDFASSIRNYGGVFESNQGGGTVIAVGGVTDFRSATIPITVQQLIVWPEATVLKNDDFTTATDERLVGE